MVFKYSIFRNLLKNLVFTSEIRNLFKNLD